MQPKDPIHQWRPPLTCDSKETIHDISFDDERIVLVIMTHKRWSLMDRVEFRTRKMYVIGKVKLNDYHPLYPSILCHLKGGWLLNYTIKSNGPIYFALIDDALRRDVQTNIISTYGIKNIEVIKHSLNKSILAIHREDKSENVLNYDTSSEILDLYEI